MKLVWGTIAFVIAAVGCGGASGATGLTKMSTGNSSLAFVGLDTASGTPVSYVADLGYFLTDVTATDSQSLTSTLFTTAGQSVAWDFVNNSLTVNGVAQSGNYAWSSPYAKYLVNSTIGNTQWAIVAGQSGASLNYFATSGNPTADQLAAQIGNSGSLSTVDQLLASNNGATTSGVTITNPTGVTTLRTAGVIGANATAGATAANSGYVGSNTNFGTSGMWRGNLYWSAFTPEGLANTSPLRILTDAAASSDPGARVLAGVFSYNAGVLTWTTAPVPEPNGYLVAALGLAIMAFAGSKRLGGR